MLKTVYSLFVDAIELSFNDILKAFVSGDDIIIKFDKKNHAIKVYTSTLKRIK